MLTTAQRGSPISPTNLERKITFGAREKDDSEYLKSALANMPDVAISFSANSENALLVTLCHLNRRGNHS